jgi:hypothetical protein
MPLIRILASAPWRAAFKRGLLRFSQVLPHASNLSQTISSILSVFVCFLKHSQSISGKPQGDYEASHVFSSCSYNHCVIKEIALRARVFWPMHAIARGCINALKMRGLDYTMLWLLKSPEWLARFRAGLDLLDWVRNEMKLHPSVFQSDEFQEEVSKEIELLGVQPVAPDRVVEDWSKNKTKELCLQRKWPKPFFPVMLQTRPGPDQTGCGAFILFSSWQDAVIALREIAKTKRYKGKERSYAAAMVYENQLVDMAGYDYPCRIILDCDAKEAQFDGVYTLNQLEESISRVPAWFCKRMVEIGAIKSTDKVVVYEKEKSRPGKASRHYIFNIMGLSTWDTRTVLNEIFTKELERQALMKANLKTEKQRLVAKARLPAPWEVTDTVPHHGRGQYSVLGFFDVKKGETEFPCITKRLLIVDGEVTKESLCRVSRTDSVLSNPHALNMLHKACYTCTVRDFITMNPQFMTQRQVRPVFIPAVRLELTHTPTVAGKKKGGWGLWRWTKRISSRSPQIPRREAFVPARLGRVSHFQDYWDIRGLSPQLSHELS